MTTNPGTSAMSVGTALTDRFDRALLRAAKRLSSISLFPKQQVLRHLALGFRPAPRTWHCRQSTTFP